jgi:hypothetical protein
VGPRVGLAAVENRKIWSLPEIEPRSSSSHTDRGIRALSVASLKIYRDRTENSKGIPVIGLRGLLVCEMLRIHNWLTDGCEIVSLTGRPRFSPCKHFHISFSAE